MRGEYFDKLTDFDAEESAIGTILKVIADYKTVTGTEATPFHSEDCGLSPLSP